MARRKLKILFLWHMHQPSYRTGTEPFLLPWTRLHATKDYAGLANIYSELPDARVTFNFTPVLWEQLMEYGQGAVDREMLLSLKPTREIQGEERDYLIRKCFTGNPISLIKPYRRYNALFEKFGSGSSRESVELQDISDAELRDLITWRVLAWMDPGERNRDAELSRLIVKGEMFTEEEKVLVFQKSLAIIRGIPGQYRDLLENGTIEMVTTPFYHPILPLLLDSRSAAEALPGIELPGNFRFREDAEWHVRAAIELHENLFGEKPRGMWPAEGSVSREAAALFAGESVQWIATDEDILAESLNITFSRDSKGRINRPDILYRPWFLNTPNGRLNIFFRDHLLSDLLGFEYQHRDSDQSVMDFLSRLRNIREQTESAEFDPHVAVILDGENAWEHYPDGGFPFLRKLFKTLTESDEFEMMTFSDYLSEASENSTELTHLRAGSWINGNFGIWIGNPEENKAWNAIDEAARTINSSPSKDNISDETRKFLRKAQASDAFWWYGDDHFTEEKPEFDRIFRNHLIQVYRSLGRRIPSYLQGTLLTEHPRKFKLKHPKIMISPVIDGKIGKYYDWFGAGTVEIRNGYAAMHGSSGQVIKSLTYGFDLDKLYLKLEPDEEFYNRLSEGIDMILRFNKPEECGDLIIKMDRVNGQVSKMGDVLPDSVGSSVMESAVSDVLEISVTFTGIGVEVEQEVDLYLEIQIGGITAVRIPDQYGLSFTRPTADYNNQMWEV